MSGWISFPGRPAVAPSPFSERIDESAGDENVATSLEISFAAMFSSLAAGMTQTETAPEQEAAGQDEFPREGAAMLPAPMPEPIPAGGIMPALLAVSMATARPAALVVPAQALSSELGNGLAPETTLPWQTGVQPSPAALPPVPGGISEPPATQQERIGPGRVAMDVLAVPSVTTGARAVSPQSETLPGISAGGTGQALRQALGERLGVQLAQGSERALIRLDPPMMGTLEIVIHREAGALKVQFSASNGEVARQLQSISEGLRQDLSLRQHMEVSVQVADSSASRFAQADSGGRHGQQSPRQQEPGRALSDPEAGEEVADYPFELDQESWRS